MKCRPAKPSKCKPVRNFKRDPNALAKRIPDDLIKVSKSSQTYTQARPNVIFKLGWFYGCLGRDGVCILFKKGTKIHSDLDGINRIEFTDSIIEEKAIEIETEPQGSGIAVRVIHTGCGI